MRIYQLIYVSSTVGLLSEPVLVELLSKARARNQQLGVTGVLLYAEGNVIQLLEGERKTVEALYYRIAADPRHKGLISLHRGYCRQRDFADWSMGFRRLSCHELNRAVPGFSPLADPQVDESQLQALSAAARTLIATFRRNVRA